MSDQEDQNLRRNESLLPDDFGAPARPAGNRTTADGIELDQWNRYRLPDPFTGEMRGWTRASTLAKTIADTYYLDLWKQRMVARGMSNRPDLMSLAASVDDPSSNEGKATLNDIAKRALEAAGGTARRDTGTALHGFTARLDRGERPAAPPHLQADVDAYASLLAAEGVIVAANMIERVVCVPEWGVAGRLDRLACFRDGIFRVIDVKTGAQADEFGGLEFVIQQAIYARGAVMSGFYNPAEGKWEPLPAGIKVDLDVAVVVHLPSGTGRASMQAVNLAAGARYAELALAVRQARRDKNLMVPWSSIRVTPAAPTPLGQIALENFQGKAMEVNLGAVIPDAAIADWNDTAASAVLDQIRAAKTVQDLHNIWKVSTSAGVWTQAHEMAAFDRSAEITAAADPILSSPPEAIINQVRSAIDGADSVNALVNIQVNARQADLWTEDLEEYARQRADVLLAAPTPITPLERVAAATTVGELSALWEELAPAGLWTDEVAAAGAARARGLGPLVGI